MIRLVSPLLIALLLIFAGASLAAWVVPVEVWRQRGVEQAGDDEFARFEGAGRAEAEWWMLRVTGPVLLVLVALAWAGRRTVARFVGGLLDELGAITTRAGRFGKWGVRVGLLAWFALAAWHAGASVARRLADWPTYRLAGGDEVLPNVSQQNRDVIRYLQHATPPDARVLVLSDQKLFFISYYALPRRLYHPMHPDAEFVIPRAYEPGQLRAYRLEDVLARDPQYLAELRPDYVLEYFEGERYVEPARVHEDATWIAFQRARYGPDYAPEFLVSLRRAEEIEEAGEEAAP